MLDKDILPSNAKKILWIVTGAAAVVLATGLFFAPVRIWANLLVATYFLLTVGLGGPVFVALTYVSGGGWHVAFRRVPEAMMALVPVAGVAILIVLAFRVREYGWQHHGADAGAFWFKEFWLTPWFWLARSAGYVLIWCLSGGWLIRRSRATPASPEAFLTSNTRLSALFLAVYAITFSLAGVDWIMALEPMWFSTIWGVYQFSGMILASLAVVVISSVWLSKPGRALHGVFNTEHLHDLGKLLLGFSCFWMYIWFSQYMLIWYANIPEETSYFIRRTHGSWGPVTIVSIVLNWVLPFLILLPKPAKRSPGVMVKVACIIILGRWVDLCLMVFPPTIGDTPAVGVWEVAAMICAVAVGALILERSFRSVAPVPTTDPYFAESLHYHA